MPRSSLSSLLFFAPSGAAGRRARCLLGASVPFRRETVAGGQKAHFLHPDTWGQVTTDTSMQSPKLPGAPLPTDANYPRLSPYHRYQPPSDRRTHLTGRGGDPRWRGTGGWAGQVTTDTSMQPPKLPGAPLPTDANYPRLSPYHRYQPPSDRRTHLTGRGGEPRWCDTGGQAVCGLLYVVNCSRIKEGGGSSTLASAAYSSLTSLASIRISVVEGTGGN
ncbi:hypothetical protein PF008_g26719 [Phytophthora fragariae]|uniref:Uncharacterized protein n=1 Tax=Phytophthora fragariae TaxID=53985 RepID=A0A6G0QGU9_9STRA|nr:hypothetical protein PF008_g26719 [Phytophthora fragariae]